VKQALSTWYVSPYSFYDGLNRFSYESYARICFRVFRQRAQYRLKMNGQVSNLTDDRLKLLKEIEFTFRVNDW
jgi:hypothetical protein